MSWATSGFESCLLRDWQLRNPTVRGAAVLMARGALILVFGVGANIVLARLLVPRDFGLVALGRRRSDGALLFADDAGICGGPPGNGASCLLGSPNGRSE